VLLLGVHHPVMRDASPQTEPATCLLDFALTHPTMLALAPTTFNAGKGGACLPQILVWARLANLPLMHAAQPR